MAFRNIIINNRCKLSYSLNYLVIRKLDVEQKIILDEIKLIMVNSQEVSITSALISELSKRKIKIIFCNDKYNPECEVVSYQNNYYSYRKLKEQLSFSLDLKNHLWKKIISKKIYNQALNLKYLNKLDDYNHLLKYIDEIEDGDISNREGHAAKVYFNSIFGNTFNRKLDNDINKYLNYGYAILVSIINRTIKSFGYLTEIGIHHIGDSNSFNLSYDFIEPLRPLVDSLVIKNLLNDENFKEECIKLLSTKVRYSGKEYYLDNAVELYIEDLFNYLKTGNIDKIKFIEYEL